MEEQEEKKEKRERESGRISREDPSALVLSIWRIQEMSWHMWIERHKNRWQLAGVR